ncbi:hypothetical protein CRM22_010571 [Opisthorchis felineus]|uniref:Small monomeric GTPase n=1 Tax=Opisthorchis felineus TaxID=147828 RepID=A0A4S2KXI2_OPIFE|nr:hypothetical protein CRM22_010571 [Opisthorchis felineus]
MHKIIRGKCVVIGPSASGKSSVVQTFVSEGKEFPSDYCMSTSAELVVKNMIIPEINDTVEIYIYTLPGKDVFSNLINKYVDHINMLMVVFDVTKKESFSSAQSALTKFHPDTHCHSRPIVLVGNKIDLEARRVVLREEAEKFADSVGISYFETSAKDALGVEAPFLHLVKEYHNLYIKKIETFRTLV